MAPLPLRCLLSRPHPRDDTRRRMDTQMRTQMHTRMRTLRVTTMQPWGRPRKEQERKKREGPTFKIANYKTIVQPRPEKHCVRHEPTGNARSGPKHPIYNGNTTQAITIPTAKLSATSRPRAVTKQSEGHSEVETVRRNNWSVTSISKDASATRKCQMDSSLIQTVKLLLLPSPMSDMQYKHGERSYKRIPGRWCGIPGYYTKAGRGVLRGEVLARRRNLFFRDFRHKTERRMSATLSEAERLGFPPIRNEPSSNQERRLPSFAGLISGKRPNQYSGHCEQTLGLSAEEIVIYSSRRGSSSHNDDKGSDGHGIADLKQFPSGDAG
ncbi:hypothetical protein BKA56DRAFT_612961 [Ilyonectria sp. MPI-CAGE-AT-0026]|nr:hypothetical protein BKA56DRAFT_612961 [Ilyonectria sp. MPI-CAGE-AT-0026]